jgi:hypothetical protein
MPKRKRPRPIQGLTDKQQRDLGEYLAEELDLESAARVFYAIEHWSALVPASTGEAFQARAARRERRDTQIAALAQQLGDALRAESDDENILAPLVELPALDRVAAAASRFIAERPKRGRHAPSEEWRDGLIALVHSHYPAAMRKVSRSGSFEKTIEKVLGYVGVELKDVHRQVLRTLRRSPRSFELRLTEPAATEPRAFLPWSAGYQPPHRGDGITRP